MEIYCLLELYDTNETGKKPVDIIRKCTCLREIIRRTLVSRCDFREDMLMDGILLQRRAWCMI